MAIECHKLKYQETKKSSQAWHKIKEKCKLV